MINANQSALYIIPNTVNYVRDRVDFAFDYILHSNTLVDSIYHADTVARSTSGWTGTNNPPAAYYAALWGSTGVLTLDQMERATKSVASLWYSAWVDAGLIVTFVNDLPSVTQPTEFELAQNYPNPFNPTTNISYRLPVGGTVSLKVFSSDGREVAMVASGNQSAGEHLVQFDGSHLASGVYFYRLQLGGFAQTRKFILLK
jgi:hypothetical protein